MSADNMIQIIKVGNKFFGYMVWLSMDYKDMEAIINKGSFQFEAENIIDAILKAQNISTEYGYHFYNLSNQTIMEVKK